MKATVCAALVVTTFAATLGTRASAQGWETSSGDTIAVPTSSARMANLDDPETRNAVFDLLLREQVGEGGPAYAVAVLQGGELIYTGTHGMADIEAGKAANADTLFDMASCTKSVTGAAIAKLVDTGEIQLDDSVREYLPQLSEAYQPVLVRHLVHHTGGVEDTQGMLALAGWPNEEPANFKETLEVLAGLQHLRFEPGAMHIYSNGGYLLLAAIVETVTETPFPEWVASELFEPAGITKSRFATGDGTAIANLAVPYAEENGETVRAPASSRYGAGGLLASITDLARWTDALRSGAGIGEGVAMLTREPGTLTDGSPVDYAFGIGPSVHDGRLVWGHAGSVPGGQSYICYYPEAELSIAVATNSLETPSPTRFAQDIATMLLGPGPNAVPAASGGPQMMLISDAQEMPEEAKGLDVDPERIATFDGTYEMEDGLTLLVASRGTQLFLGFGSEPTIEIFRCAADDPNAFLLNQPGWELHFAPEADELTIVVRESVQGGSRTIPGKRHVVEPLTEANTAELVGTFDSDELKTSYEVVWEDEALWLVHERHGRLAMTPMTEGTFTLPGKALAQVTYVRQGNDVAGIELQAYSWGASSYFTRR